MPVKDRSRYRKILFPTDFSDASIAAAGYALSAAKGNRAAIIVLHVVDTGKEAAGFYIPHVSYDRLDREMLGAAKDMLRDFCLRWFKGCKSVSQEVVSGEPDKEILKAAKTSGADLVVMGTFGKKGVERFLLGSTVDRVLRSAPCPVLVVPAI